MRLKDKLKHPFALMGQGFVLGAALFWAVNAGPSDARGVSDDTPASVSADARMSD